MIMVECLRETDWDMCGACEHYDGETGECTATDEEIKRINEARQS